VPAEAERTPEVRDFDAARPEAIVAALAGVVDGADAADGAASPRRTAVIEPVFMN
jgi:hypothetical protein